MAAMKFAPIFRQRSCTQSHLAQKQLAKYETRFRERVPIGKRCYACGAPLVSLAETEASKTVIAPLRASSYFIYNSSETHLESVVSPTSRW